MYSKADTGPERKAGAERTAGEVLCTSGVDGGYRHPAREGEETGPGGLIATTIGEDLDGLRRASRQ